MAEHLETEVAGKDRDTLYYLRYIGLLPSGKDESFGTTLRAGKDEWEIIMLI